MNKIERPIFDGEVLLCEDSKMNQDIICDHFARVGLKTVVAENGLEGVETFRNRARSAAQNGEKLFDLVFMDIQMPVMDGLAAAAEINTINAETPIIAMTANVAPADREEYAAHGMKDCVRKPFTSQDLRSCLLKYLKPVNAGAIGAADSPANADPSAEYDENFWKRMIRLFIRENKNKYDEIVNAINSGDIKLANRLAHTLKSNAGHLGKTGLQKAAKDVEYLLKDENNLVTPHELNTLKTELDAVLKEFSAHETEQPGGAAVPHVALGAEEKQVLINKLELLLEGGNPECLSLIDSLRAMPESEEMIMQMESFNFDTALKILGKLRQKWG